MEDNSTEHNTYKKLAVQWLNEVLCFVSSSLLPDPRRRMLRNHQLLKSAKPLCVSLKNDSANLKLTAKNNFDKLKTEKAENRLE